MAPNKIAFVGNCQALALAHVYRAHIGRPDGQLVSWVNPAKWDDDGRSAIAEADVIVFQVRDFQSGPTKNDLPTAARRHYFPQVAGGFLWPYGNQHHPLTTHELGSPYPIDLSDRFLNRMIASGVAPEEAVERYLELDVNRHVSLDRLFELFLEKQRQRDAETGYDLANIIESHFRSQRLFLTPGHPDMLIFRATFSHFCDEMGIARGRSEGVLASLQHTPYPSAEMPIHPRVIEHFGLSFVDQYSQYRFWDEGKFSFAEFSLRYIKFQHSKRLFDGMSLFRSGSNDEALAELEIGVQEAPRSAEGYNAISMILGDRGDLEEAITKSRIACSIEPQSARFVAQLTKLLVQLSERAGSPELAAEAEAMLRDAIAATPAITGPHAAKLYDELAKLCLKQGRIDEGIDALRRTLQAGGPNPHVHGHLGNVLAAHRDPEAGVEHLRLAIRMAPEVVNFHTSLARALVRQSKLDEAVAALQRALALEPDNQDCRRQITALLQQQEVGRAAADTPAKEAANTTLRAETAESDAPTIVAPLPIAVGPAPSKITNSAPIPVPRLQPALVKGTSLRKRFVSLLGRSKDGPGAATR